MSDILSSPTSNHFPSEAEAGSDYAKKLGQRLRAIRQQQGLSLQGVEEKSAGKWKAVVIGSYERGDRSVTVARLSELAEFYRVPIAELLPGSGPTRIDSAGKVAIDLEALTKLRGEDFAPLLRFVRSIQHQRGDYNGKVLSIRGDDIRALAIVFDLSPSDLVSRLESWGVLYRPMMVE
jgi:transcriptional regulator with XRE-family HTH domain